MGTELQWLGMAAGSLIAVGTVVRWTWLRVTRAARWTAAMVELPETVADLGRCVVTLTGAVDRLSVAVEERHPRVTLERL